MDNRFINEAYTLAIKDYLSNKHNDSGITFNSFPVVVIRLLCMIYDELDIITPYHLHDEEMFYMNLQKYDYPLANIITFNEMFLNYYNNPNEDEFINIQKMLVDMFAHKKVELDLTDDDIQNFKKLLYSPVSNNPLLIAYNYKMANDSSEVLDYCNEVLSKNIKKKVVKEKKVLSFDAYKALNLTSDTIDNMDADELDVVNKRVYNYFSINENAINKEYLLDKAVNSFANPKPKFSTGNGYIDILFILAMIAVLIMIVLIITLIIT